MNKNFAMLYLEQQPPPSNPINSPPLVASSATTSSTPVRVVSLIQESPLQLSCDLIRMVTPLSLPPTVPFRHYNTWSHGWKDKDALTTI